MASQRDKSWFAIKLILKTLLNHLITVLNTINRLPALNHLIRNCCFLFPIGLLCCVVFTPATILLGQIYSFSLSLSLSLSRALFLSLTNTISHKHFPLPPLSFTFYPLFPTLLPPLSFHSSLALSLFRYLLLPSFWLSLSLSLSLSLFQVLFPTLFSLFLSHSLSLLLSLSFFPTPSPASQD